jgi:hypothetical protein
MACIRIELGAMLAAGDEIAILVQKLAWPRIQSRAVVRAGVFKSEQLIGLARDQDRPRLGLATLLRPHQNKPSRLTLVNLECPAYRKKLIHRRNPSDKIECVGREEAELNY